MGCHNSKEKNNNSGSNHGPFRLNISKKSKQIVQEMWIVLKPESKNFGVVLFVRMFEEYPDIQDLFYNFKDLKNQDELVQSLKELDHVARVMNSFGSCIELLDDGKQFADTVQRLGAVHRKIAVQPEHLDAFGKVVIESLCEYCQSSWTKEKEKAWREVLGVLASNFEIGLRGGGSLIEDEKYDTT